MLGSIASRRTVRLVDALRAGQRPTMAENIACIASMEELEAFRAEYVARRGPLPTDVFRALAARRGEIQGGAV